MRSTMRLRCTIENLERGAVLARARPASLAARVHPACSVGPRRVRRDPAQFWGAKQTNRSFWQGHMHAQTSL
jgi:hypothetical protein